MFLVQGSFLLPSSPIINTIYHDLGFELGPKGLETLACIMFLPTTRNRLYNCPTEAYVSPSIASILRTALLSVFPLLPFACHRNYASLNSNRCRARKAQELLPCRLLRMCVSRHSFRPL